MNSPEMAKALHKAVAAHFQGEGYDHYETYRQILQQRPVTALRDLLEFNSDRASIANRGSRIDRKYPATLLHRGMSSVPWVEEAHETLAIAMNRIGGKSNSGEGGEDSDPLHQLKRCG
jgi:glutamate synthase (ferredoxin)